MELPFFAKLLLYTVNVKARHFIIETKGYFLVIFLPLKYIFYFKSDSVSTTAGSDDLDGDGEDYRMKLSKGGYTRSFVAKMQN